MSLMQDTYINTGEIVADWTTQDRASFAAVSGSGELPLIDVLADHPGAVTKRITIPVLYGTPTVPAGPKRPRWYRGAHTQAAVWSRQALTAATRDGAR